MENETGNSDPIDIFSSSLEALFDYEPVTLASAGATYTHECHNPNNHGIDVHPAKITLLTPDTLPENWSLHASDIWTSSRYLADHLAELGLENLCSKNDDRIQVLELGASAGLPGILVAKTYGPHVSIVVSDYPDDLLIKTLSDNVIRNGVAECCRVLPYAWGSDPSPFLAHTVNGFDTIMAADTLWNPNLHMLFVKTLQMVLRRSPSARVHLVAGLHTGRYTIQSFLNAAQQAGFDIENAVEKQIKGSQEKAWSVVGEEDDKERRRWLVWIVLKWKESHIKDISHTQLQP